MSILRNSVRRGNGGAKEVKYGRPEDSIYDDYTDIKNQDALLTRHDLKLRAAQILQNTRASLPVFVHRDELMGHLLKHQIVILIGETGSGKSTQIPQFLLEHGLQQGDQSKKCYIAVTQPRRVAAINLATRVAHEYGCHVGDTVGYSVRFDSAVSKRTKLQYLTDGMLLRDLMFDKNLSQYSTIIIDEAHERTILTDLILGFLKTLLKTTRPDLKVIVMSATLQANLFSQFLDDAPILFVEGRKFTVEQYYLKTPTDDIVDAAVKACIQISMGEPLGDILCFLPGQEEIDKAVILLNNISQLLGADKKDKKHEKVPQILAFPLYAALPPQQQAMVFNALRGFRRKVIFSTNIAETSVTIPGVRYVIDSGLRKVKVWRHQLGLSTLLTVPISKASAMQRSGRAGREAEGKCFRLFCEDDFMNLPPVTEAEISRTEISSPVLLLKKYGVDDIVNWTWFEYPGKEPLISALKELYQLGALDDCGKITSRGQSMALLPLSVNLSCVIISAHEMGCLSEIIDIASCLSVENLLLNPTPEERDVVNERRFELCVAGKTYGDLIMLKELFDIYHNDVQSTDKLQWCKDLCISYRGFKNVFKVRDQLKFYCKRLFKDWDDVKDSNGKASLNSDTIAQILKCFLVGFSKNTAIGFPDRSYRTVASGENISIHPSSLLFMNSTCPGILYIEHIFTTKSYARTVSRIELSWLQEITNIAGSKQKIHD